MADPADVVPLRRAGHPPHDEPAAVLADAADPARTLSLTWSPDGRAIRFGIDTPHEAARAVVLSADDLLDLVRVLMEGPPRPGAGRSASAIVLPLRRRESHPSTGGS